MLTVIREPVFRDIAQRWSGPATDSRQLQLLDQELRLERGGRQQRNRKCAEGQRPLAIRLRLRPYEDFTLFVEFSLSRAKGRHSNEPRRSVAPDRAESPVRRTCYQRPCRIVFYMIHSCEKGSV